MTRSNSSVPVFPGGQDAPRLHGHGDITVRLDDGFDDVVGAGEGLVDAGDMG